VSDFQIRPARPDEYGEVGRLTVAAYTSDGLLPEGHDYAAELADATGRAQTSTLLVAVDADDHVLGTVTFCRPGSPEAEVARPGEAEFRMLAVAPAARGRGVGEALVRACLDRAREHGDTAVVLSTQAAMRSAHRIYERFGFTRLPERDWRPVNPVLLQVYRLELTPAAP
jgi:ribosomal protein S18 acetylase RimI-like enzyme